MGNWTTAKTTTYFNVRLTKDAKHFPKNEATKQGAATFLSIVDGTKGGEDIFVDVKVQRGAEKLATLKKGAELTVTGRVEFSLDQSGKLRGKIWDAHVELTAATRAALTDIAASAGAPATAPDHVDDSAAPAFE